MITRSCSLAGVRCSSLRPEVVRLQTRLQLQQRQLIGSSAAQLMCSCCACLRHVFVKPVACRTLQQ
jgi:hypothetical protein